MRHQLWSVSSLLYVTMRWRYQCIFSFIEEQWDKIRFQFVSSSLRETMWHTRHWCCFQFLTCKNWTQTRFQCCFQILKGNNVTQDSNVASNFLHATMGHKQGSNVVFSFLQEMRQKKGNPYVFPDSFTWVIDTQGGAQDVQLVSSKEFTIMACHFFPLCTRVSLPCNGACQFEVSRSTHFCLSARLHNKRNCVWIELQIECKWRNNPHGSHTDKPQPRIHGAKAKATRLKFKSLISRSNLRHRTSQNQEGGKQLHRPCTWWCRWSSSSLHSSLVFFSLPNKDQVWITAGSRLGLFVSFTRQIGHLFLEEDFHSLRAQEVQILACPHGISKALFLDVGFQQRGNPWQSFSNPRPSFVSPISSKQIAHSGRLLRFLFLSSSSSVCSSFFSSSSSSCSSSCCCRRYTWESLEENVVSAMNLCNDSSVRKTLASISCRPSCSLCQRRNNWMTTKRGSKESTQKMRWRW